MTHLINRLKLEAICPDEEMAFNLRHNFVKTLQLQIASVVDRLCTQYVPVDEWIQIDKLEINMGQLSPDTLDSEFDRVFHFRFEKELLAKLSAISPELRNHSAHSSMLNLLKHFLKNGVLPWWADEDVINLEAVCNDVFTHSVELIRIFLLHEARNPVLWQRVAFQLPDKTKQQIVQLLKPLEAARESLDKLEAGLQEEINKLSCEQKASVLKKLQKHSGRTVDLVLCNTPAFFAAGDNRLQINDTSQVVLLQLFAANPDDYELVKTAYSRLPGTIQILPAGKSEDYSNETATRKIKQETEVQHPNSGEKTEVTVHTPEIADGAVEEEPGEEKLLVKGAGIILLAPFLKPFFSKLQLLDANQLISNEAQVKAVYLLKYLGSGNQHCQEYQLVLEKLLCGMPINQPLEAAPEFTQAETDEAEELLRSVLVHWQRLKNTSVNGLRESFLKRDGIITPKENNWLLRVERKTLDVLVDTIPWGFSTVCLPWNRYIIFTEW